MISNRANLVFLNFTCNAIKGYVVKIVVKIVDACVVGSRNNENFLSFSSRSHTSEVQTTCGVELSAYATVDGLINRKTSRRKRNFISPFYPHIQ